MEAALIMQTAVDRFTFKFREIAEISGSDYHRGLFKSLLQVAVYNTQLSIAKCHEVLPSFLHQVLQMYLRNSSPAKKEGPIFEAVMKEYIKAVMHVILIRMKAPIMTLVEHNAKTYQIFKELLECKAISKTAFTHHLLCDTPTLEQIKDYVKKVAPTDCLEWLEKVIRRISESFDITLVEMTSERLPWIEVHLNRFMVFLYNLCVDLSKRPDLLEEEKLKQLALLCMEELRQKSNLATINWPTFKNSVSGINMFYRFYDVQLVLKNYGACLDNLARVVALKIEAGLDYSRTLQLYIGNGSQNQPTAIFTY